MSELFKAESTAIKQVSSGHTEKATVKVMAFPCGDGIPSLSQKGCGNRGDWLRHYFPKTTQIGLPMPHWCLLPVKAKKILPKAMLSSAWREFLSVKIDATFLHTPPMYAIGIMSENCSAPPMCIGN